jgi:type II secretory pathway pseudopilin PulG
MSITKTFMRKKTAGFSGFTLVEIIILIGVLSAITLAMIVFQQDFFKINRLVEGSLNRENETRRLLTSFTNELRSASPSDTGSFLIEQATTDSFIFFANIDGDNLKERLRYFRDGSIFKKGTLKPSGNPLTYNPANEVIKDLIKDITAGAIFLYYDSAYDGTTPPLTQPVDVSKIRLVKTIVTIDTNGPKPPEPVSVKVQAVVRGLRFQ